MCKILCAAVLLLPTCILAQGNKSAGAAAPATTFSSPQIVAKAKLPHQTAAIPLTTMFAPTQTGLYRLSVYGTLLNTGTTGAYWSFNLGWTDDAGPQTTNSLIVGWDPNGGQFVQLWNIGFNQPSGGPVITFEAKASQPITYSVTFNGDPDGTAYSLYYVLERLE
jgi:hypothetical protein